MNKVIGSLIDSVAYGLSRTATQVEGTDKALKNYLGLYDFFNYILGGNNETLSIVSHEFRTLTTMFGATASLNRIKEWTLADERAKFITNAKKTAAKVFLTAANFLESIKYLATIQLINLGIVNSTQVLIPILERTVELSPIGIAKDLGVVIASTITLTDSDNAVRDVRRNLAKAKIDELKRRKWELKTEVAKALTNAVNRGAVEAQLLDLNNQHRLDYITLRLEIEDRKRGVGKTREEIQNKWVQFVQEPARTLKSFNSGLAIANFWKLAGTVHENNKWKVGIGIANDIGKVAIIMTALIGLTILGLATVPAFMVPFLFLGVVVSTIGYVKFLFDDWYKQKEASLAQTRINNLHVGNIAAKY